MLNGGTKYSTIPTIMFHRLEPFKLPPRNISTSSTAIINCRYRSIFNACFVKIYARHILSFKFVQFLCISYTNTSSLSEVISHAQSNVLSLMADILDSDYEIQSNDG